MAPEMFKDREYNNKIDIWALGILLDTLLFGQNFFSLGVQCE